MPTKFKFKAIEAVEEGGGEIIALPVCEDQKTRSKQSKR